MRTLRRDLCATVTSLAIICLSVLLFSPIEDCRGQEMGQHLNSPATTDISYPYQYQEEETQPEQELLESGTDLIPQTSRVKNRRKKLRRRNRFRNRVKNRFRYEEKKKPSSTDEYEYDDENGYDQDRDDGYKAPASGYNAPSSGYKAPASSYEAPASSYEAPASSYEAPSSSYGAPSYNAPSYGGGGKGDGFNDFLNALAAFLPIGLFLAAIPPNLITISTGKRRKKRDESSSGLNEIDPRFDSEHPFLARINEIGFGQLRESRDCQKKIFCEMSKFGATQENANMIQKIFHYLSMILPDTLPDYLDEQHYFALVRAGNCDLFKCNNNNSSSNNNNNSSSHHQMFEDF